jgi:hypothetical protein
MATKRKPRLGSASFTPVETFEFTTAQREKLNKILVGQNRNKRKSNNNRAPKGGRAIANKWPEKWPDGFVAGLETICAAWQAVSRTEEEGSKPSEVAAGLDVLLKKITELRDLLGSGPASLGCEVHDKIILANATVGYSLKPCPDGKKSPQRAIVEKLEEKYRLGAKAEDRLSWLNVKQRLLSDLALASSWVSAARSGRVRRGRPYDWSKEFLVECIEALFRECGFKTGSAETAPYYQVIAFIDGAAARLTRRRRSKSPQ